MASSGRRERRIGPAAGWAVEVLVWTLLAWGIWLVSLSAADVPDLLVGGASSVLCGVAAAGSRRLIGAKWRPARRLGKPMALLPWSIFVDAAAVLIAPWRPGHSGGRIERVAIGAAGPSPTARARRAVATTVVSAAPASVVIDADDTGALTVHTLRSPGPKLHERYAER